MNVGQTLSIVKLLAKFVHVSIESDTRILRFDQDLIGPNNIVSIDAEHNLFTDIFNNIFGCLVFVQENVNLLCNGVFICLAEGVKTSFYVVRILFFVVLVYVATLQHRQETFVLLQSKF